LTIEPVSHLTPLCQGGEVLQVPPLAKGDGGGFIDQYYTNINKEEDILLLMPPFTECLPNE